MPFVARPDGMRLWFERAGNANEPALLMMEGMGGDLPGWRRNIPALAQVCDVVAYDHRGNGQSDEPSGPCTMTTFVDDAVALLDHLSIERAHVYGQSFGGMVAQELALTHPDRVRRLVLACTHAGGAHVVAADPRTPIGEPWRALYGRSFPDEHPDHVAEDLRVGSEQPRHPEGGRRQWEAMRSFDAYDRLGSITAATLVIHGTDDRLVAPANAAVLADRIPGAELLWLEGAGHLYHSEQPEAADAAVIDFVMRDRDA